jgi:hypothetical protein
MTTYSASLVDRPVVASSRREVEKRRDNGDRHYVAEAEQGSRMGDRTRFHGFIQLKGRIIGHER